MIVYRFRSFVSFVSFVVIALKVPEPQRTQSYMKEVCSEYGVLNDAFVSSAPAVPVKSFRIAMNVSRIRNQ